LCHTAKRQTMGTMM
jgi:hypothetical protein